MVDTMELHLIIYSARNDIAWRERESFVVFMHKLLSVGQSEDATVSSHRLGDEVGRVRFSRVIQCRGVELYELHSLYFAFGAIYHCDAIASGDVRVGGRGIDRTSAAGSHQRDLSQICIYPMRFRIEDIRTITFDIRGSTRDANAQMVLGDDLYREVVFQYIDIRIASDGLHQPALNLKAGVVSMMENAKLRMAALAM